MNALLMLACLAVASPRAEILQEVREIAAPGSPGNVVAWGDHAQLLVVDRDGDGVIATVQSPGRVMALAHNGYLSAYGAHDTGKLLVQGARWAGRGAPSRLFVDGNEGLRQFLSSQGLRAESGRGDWGGGAGEVVVIDAHRVGQAEVGKIQAFVRRGGGLVIAATGWGWQQGSQASMWRFHANEALRPFGIGFGEDFTQKDGGDRFLTDREPPLAAHSGEALKLLASGQGDQRQAGQAALRLLRVLPTSDNWLKDRVGQMGGGVPVEIGPKSKLGPNEGRKRFLTAYQWQQIERGEFGRAHPSSALFPGQVPNTAKRETVEVSVRANESRWQGLGLYAPPGEAVVLRVPTEWVGKGHRVRIGAHTDTNWHHNTWERFPQVSMAWPIESAEVKVTSPFGGLIYVDLRQGLPAATTLRAENVVRAPRFVLGETSPQQWSSSRQSPAPWAEIESKHLVVTVPSDAVRQLADPTQVAEFWDKIADSAADLAQTPRWRGFKERFVADAQISAGYMHAGYPIKTHLDVTDLVTNVGTLRAKGSWGHFHELGHNHQSDLWTFDGTVEVTVNLFTLYAYDRVVGSRPADRRFDAEQCLKVYQEFSKKGKGFGRWSDEPFTALAMYAQLQNAFGWQAFKNVFRAYQQIPANQRPRSQQEKRDQWMIRFSREVGRNLGPFFEAWTVPTTPSARASIADLRPWMPDGM